MEAGSAGPLKATGDALDSMLTDLDSCKLHVLVVRPFLEGESKKEADLSRSVSVTVPVGAVWLVLTVPVSPECDRGHVEKCPFGWSM